MSSNLTNPEQVCPTCKSFDPGFRNRTDGSPLYGPLCTDSWHGKVAAKPQLHMSGDGNGNWRECECEIGDNHLRDTSPVEAAKPDDLHELFYDNVADARAALEAKYAAPAPVDQPDERIRNSIASIIGVETDRYGVSEQYLIRDGDGLVLAGVDFRAELDEIVDYIARERELAAKEALKYLLDLWETRKLRGVEVDYEGDVERELAALTKGEST